MPHNLVITIFRDNVIFDITNVTDKLVRSRIPTAPSIDAQSRYEDTDQNKAIISRYIDKFDKLVRSRLQAYIVRDDSGMTTTVETEEYEGVEYDVTTTEEEVSNDIVPLLSDDLVYTLEFPIKWQHEQTDLLRQAIHDYLVNACIAEYLEITNPKESVLFKQKADNSYIDIKACITARDSQIKYGYPFDNRVR